MIISPPFPTHEPDEKISIAPDAVEVAIAVVRDWVSENREVIEAGGDGDARELVTSINRVLKTNQKY